MKWTKYLKGIHWTYICLGRKLDDQDTGSPKNTTYIPLHINWCLRACHLYILIKEDTNEPRWGGKEYIQKKWEVVDILECRNGYKKIKLL